MRDVAWAILEARGKISFIQRSQADGDDQPPPQPKGAEDDSTA
jgi:uncharacterized membrane protein YcaP (DUF421 family)